MRDKKCAMIETAFLAEEIEYTGAELRSHFVREKSGIEWDGVIAFVGPCGVAGERLVDLEDAEEQHEIVSKRMLHFIAEQFQQPLREGNVRLRLFATIVKETLEEMSPGIEIKRDGDDLFVNDRKLTVAICTSSLSRRSFTTGSISIRRALPSPRSGSRNSTSIRSGSVSPFSTGTSASASRSSAR